jgi:hypothetical protein
MILSTTEKSVRKAMNVPAIKQAKAECTKLK